RGPGQQQSPAREQSEAEAREQLMKLTDLFVKRPVLAIVVNLVVLIAGLQSIRALSVRQYPRSDIAVVRVSTLYVGANADLVRRSRSEPDHRLSHARRPAQAERDRRRPARRHPRRAHVRDADLAQAGPHGGARYLGVSAARGIGAEQLPVGARTNKRLDGVGE